MARKKPNSTSNDWIHAERFAGTEANTDQFYDALAAKFAAFPSFSREARKVRAALQRARGTRNEQLRITRRSPDIPRGWRAETLRRRARLNESGKALDHIVSFMHAKIGGLECDANLQKLPSARANHRKNAHEAISDEEAVEHVRAGRACPWDLIDQKGNVTGTKQQPIWEALDILLGIMAEAPDMTFQQMTDIARELRAQAEAD